MRQRLSFLVFIPFDFIFIRSRSREQITSESAAPLRLERSPPEAAASNIPVRRSTQKARLRRAAVSPIYVKAEAAECRQASAGPKDFRTPPSSAWHPKGKLPASRPHLPQRNFKLPAVFPYPCGKTAGFFKEITDIICNIPYYICKNK